jgi:aryl-alcohol dehydrogenase
MTGTTEGAPMEITAAVLRSHDGAYVLEQVDLAAPAPGEVLVRVVGAGMCHTDVLPRSPLFPAQPPIITGHEGSGVVQAMGPGVTGVSVGDHVVMSFDSCGSCANCHGAHPAYCDTFFQRNLFGRRVDGSTGVTDAAGAPVSSRWFGQSSFATHAIATSRNLVVVDRALPLEMLGPLGCGILTGAGSVLVALAVTPGSSIAVFGAGAVGLAAVMAARVAGATTIVAVDLHQHRLELALRSGATHVIDGRSDDVTGQILSLTGGVQYAFDTTGSPAVIAAAVGALRATGVCGLVGVQTQPLVLDPSALALGRTVMGIIEGDAVPQRLIPQLIALWQQGRFPFDQLVQTFPLSGINEAEQASLRGDVVKPVLIPG